MSDELNKTIRLQLASDLGRSSSDDETELELISTQELHLLLENDDEKRKDLEAVADGEDGVLARNVQNDQFEIVDRDHVAAALARAEEKRPLDITGTALAETNSDGEQGLSLVSTMMLKRMLDPAAEQKQKSKPKAKPAAGAATIAGELDDFKNAGFDPYNSS